MGGASKSLQTPGASLGFLCVVFSSASCTASVARPGRAEGRADCFAPFCSLGGAGRRLHSPGPHPTTSDRGQQSVVIAARVEEGARVKEELLGEASRLVHYLIKSFFRTCV